jgi:hypothetical protein
VLLWVKRGEFSVSREHMGYETGILRPGISSVVKAVAKIYQVPEVIPSTFAFPAERK